MEPIKAPFLFLQPPMALVCRTRGGLRTRPPLHFYDMRTWLYIDGGNLHAAVKGTPLAELDPVALVAQAFPDNAIHCVKYFASPLPGGIGPDPEVVAQRRYWRRLRELPNFYLIEGRPRRRALPAGAGERLEERGNNINLASHLLSDAMLGNFDAAIVVTPNPDFALPIRLARRNAGLPIGVLNPQRLSGPARPRPRPCAELRAAAAFYQNGVTWNQLRRAQFAPDGLAEEPRAA